MKTAMQESIDRLVDLSNATFFNGKKSDCDIIDRIKNILRNEYLQKEREQMHNILTWYQSKSQEYRNNTLLVDAVNDYYETAFKK